MAIKYSDTVNNAMLQAIETAIGVSPVLEIRTGAMPSHLSDEPSGSLLASLPLPSDWMNDPASHVVTKKGTWEDTSADGTGTAGHFAIKDSGGTYHIMGTVTATGGGGDMTLDNTSIASTQDIVVTAFQITRGNVGA